MCRTDVKQLPHHRSETHAAGRFIVIRRSLYNSACGAGTHIQSFVTVVWVTGFRHPASRHWPAYLDKSTGSERVVCSCRVLASSLSSIALLTASRGGLLSNKNAGLLRTRAVAAAIGKTWKRTAAVRAGPCGCLTHSSADRTPSQPPQQRAAAGSDAPPLCVDIQPEQTVWRARAALAVAKARASCKREDSSAGHCECVADACTLKWSPTRSTSPGGRWATMAILSSWLPLGGLKTTCKST